MYISILYIIAQKRQESQRRVCRISALFAAGFCIIGRFRPPRCIPKTKKHLRRTGAFLLGDLRLTRVQKEMNERVKTGLSE
jgi:hypothetical protein